MGKKMRKWRVTGTIIFDIDYEMEAETYEDALGIAGNEIADLRYVDPDRLIDNYMPDFDVEPEDDSEEEDSEDEDTDEESEDEDE